MLLEIGTVDGQSRRVADVPGPVRRNARILARVSRCYGLDAQCAHMLIDFRDRHIRIVETYRSTVKLPHDLYRKVAFHYGTSGRDHVARVRRSVTDRERSYMRRNYNDIETAV